jgi:hypothetical protein
MSDTVQHDTTRRQKIEINEPALTHRLFQNSFKEWMQWFCLIRKIVPKYGTTVDEASFSKSFYYSSQL